MTLEEFFKIPVRMVSHLSMEDEHCATYMSADGRFGCCCHTPYKDGRPYGRAYRHFMVDGKVYKSKKKLEEAIKDIDLCTSHSTS